jgi:hypothetical protein
MGSPDGCGSRRYSDRCRRSLRPDLPL